MSQEYYDDLKRFPRWKRMSFHHFHYNHLRWRGSILFIDGLYIPDWIHVPVIHRLLGGGDRVRDQRFGRFPNIAQRTVHYSLRLVMPFVYLFHWMK